LRFASTFASRRPRPRAVLRRELDGDEPPPEFERGHRRRAASGEGVKHDVVGLRECADEPPHGGDRLFGRVPPVAAVLPREHVGDGSLRERRPPFGEKISALVAVFEEPAAGVRAVGLRPDNLSGGAEPGRLPRRKKFVRAVPAVEAHAEAVGLQDAGGLFKRGEEPYEVVVVRHASPRAVAVACAVGRVG